MSCRKARPAITVLEGDIVVESRAKSKGRGFVLVDLNTQVDFLDPKGTHPVCNRDELVPKIAKIFEWATCKQIPVVSSIDSHREGERQNGIPEHCIDGSPGQKKIPSTLLARSLMVEVDNTLGLTRDLLTRYDQILFRKRSPDFFHNPKADRFFSEVHNAEFVISGLGMETSVRALALGLLARGRRVTVIVDGCGFWNAGEAAFALRLVETKGARLVRVSDLPALAPQEHSVVFGHVGDETDPLGFHRRAGCAAPETGSVLKGLNGHNPQGIVTGSVRNGVVPKNGKLRKGP